MTRAVVFAYSEVGVRCLRVLLEAGIEIPLLFTHADDPKEQQWFGSVADLGKRHGLRIETPADPNTPEWVALGRAAAPEFLFSFYYRYLLKAPWLALAPRGALNMHGSLLPRYRGRAPVHWAILNGEREIGASLHYMVEKPDAGALVGQEAVPIFENDTALEVSEKVAGAAERLLARLLPDLVAGRAPAIPLDLTQGSYFGRRTPEDGRIDWSWGAKRVHDLVRAVAPPFPGAFSDVNGCRLAILETRVDAEPARHPSRAPCLYAEDGVWFADCADGRRLRILRLESAGRPVTPAAPPAPLAAQPVSLSNP